MKKNIILSALFLCLFNVLANSSSSFETNSFRQNKQTPIMLTDIDGKKLVSIDNGRTWKIDRNFNIYSIRLKAGSKNFISNDMGRSWKEDNQRYIYVIRLFQQGKKFISYDMGRSWSKVEETERVDELIAVAYPNPVQEMLYIKFNNELKNYVNVELFNYLGIKIYSSSIKADGNILSVDLGLIKPGAYLLKANSSNFSMAKIIVVAR